MKNKLENVKFFNDVSGKQREIASLFIEAGETGDKNKEIIAYIEAVKERMKEYWGVENLSMIEVLKLRRIVEECLVQLNKDTKLGKDDDFLFEVESEAAARWLWELYDIKPKDIPYLYIIEDKTTDKKYKYQEAEIDDYDKKIEELKEQKHRTYDFGHVTNDFKEYLRRKREEARLV